MLIRYETKQLRRTPLRMTALVLGLALMTVMVTVSAGLKLAVSDAMERLEKEYITTARASSPSEYAFGTDKEYMEAIAKNREDHGRFDEIRGSMQSIEFYTEHSMLAAYDENVVPLTSGSSKDATYSFDLDRPNNVVVLAVRCDEVISVPREKIYYTDSAPLYSYRMTVEQVVSAHEEVAVTETLFIGSGVSLKDGTIPFSVGGRYLLWGLYDASAQNRGTLTLIPDSNSGCNPWLTEEDGNYMGETYWKDTEYKPILADLGEMTVEEFQQTAAWEKWASAMELVEISQRTLRIFSTDRVNAYTAFMMREAKIVEGRDFTAEEIEAGAKVCVINVTLAQKNGLSVGDVLELKMYETQYTRNLWDETATACLSMLYQAGYREDRAAEENGSYTIVGLYETDDWEQGSVTATVHPNTVIVPQSALSRQYRTGANIYESSTLILPNGGIAAFEAELAANGISPVFAYDDQGYTSVIPHLTALFDATDSLYRMCLILWVLLVSAMIVMYVLMQKPMARVKYCVGVSRRRIWGHTLLGGVLILLCGALLGTVGGVLLYDVALEKLMASGFTVFYTAFGSQSESPEILSQVLDLLQQSPRTLCELGAWQFVTMLGMLVVVSVWFVGSKKRFR